MFPPQPQPRGSVELSEKHVQALQVHCPYFPGSSNLVGGFALVNLAPKDIINKQTNIFRPKASTKMLLTEAEAAAAAERIIHARVSAQDDALYLVDSPESRTAERTRGKRRFPSKAAAS